MATVELTLEQLRDALLQLPEPQRGKQPLRQCGGCLLPQTLQLSRRRAHYSWRVLPSTPLALMKNTA
jgi:hypothetical protein